MKKLVTDIQFFPNILLVILSVLITYGLLEVAYRVFWYARLTSNYKTYAFIAVDAPVYQFDLQSGYRYKPDSTYRWMFYNADNMLVRSSQVRVNNIGLISSHNRDLEPRDPGEFRIVVLGDSVTASMTNDIPWVDILDDLLNADTNLKATLGVSKFSVMNYGREGTGVVQFADVFVNEAKNVSPDLVLVNFISDDIIRKFIWRTMLASPSSASPDVSWILQCYSLPANLENPDCNFVNTLVVGSDVLTVSEKLRVAKRDIYNYRVAQIPWLSLYPNLLASLDRDNVLGLRSSFQSRLNLDAILHNYTDDEGVAASQAALQKISEQQSRVLALHTPLPNEIESGQVPGYVHAFVDRVTNLVEVVPMASIMPVASANPEEISRWYNTADTHFSNTGAEVYAKAAYYVLREYLTSYSKLGPQTQSNLVMIGTVTQSSTEIGYPAVLAADGNKDGNFTHQSVASTKDEFGPWWEVDLGSVYRIDTIKIWLPTDCCSERLIGTGLDVLISDTPFTSTGNTIVDHQEEVWEYSASPEWPLYSMIPISLNRSGRYIRVQLSGVSTLALAEVQVFGRNWSLLDDLNIP